MNTSANQTITVDPVEVKPNRFLPPSLFSSKPLRKWSVKVDGEEYAQFWSYADALRVKAAMIGNVVGDRRVGHVR